LRPDGQSFKADAIFDHLLRSSPRCNWGALQNLRAAAHPQNSSPIERNRLKRSADVRSQLEDCGNPRGAHAHACTECERLRGTGRAVDQRGRLDCMIPIRERHFRRAVAEYVVHYHAKRNHHGIANRLISGPPVIATTGRVRRPPRLGGLLNFYQRAA
jgi:hypothetical protein